jgi:hypothetical protein
LNTLFNNCAQLSLRCFIISGSFLSFFAVTCSASFLGTTFDLYFA